MGKIISLGIQKGGSGKTTSTAMIAHELSTRGFKVLAVDFDSQGNLTQFLSRRDPYDFMHKTIFEACKERDPRPYIVRLNENLHLLPAEDFLSKFASWILIDYPKIMRQEFNSDPYAPSKVLKETLNKVKHEYDFILIDLPPNLGEQTINGMAASDYALVVLQTEPFCKSALERYLETLEGSINMLNPDTRLLGILASMTMTKVSLGDSILLQTQEEYGELVFNTVIKRRAVIMEYSFTGIKEATTKISKDVYQMYINLVDEILVRTGVGLTP